MSASGANRLRPAPRETVELVESEWVVAHGAARTHWFVRVRNGWTAARAMPGARVEALAPEPGVVWTRRIELELTRGTLLLQVRSAPRSIRKSPLGFLESGFGTARRVLRTFHRVGRAGTLFRDPGARPAREQG